MLLLQQTFHFSQQGWDVAAKIASVVASAAVDGAVKFFGFILHTTEGLTGATNAILLFWHGAILYAGCFECGDEFFKNTIVNLLLLGRYGLAVAVYPFGDTIWRYCNLVAAVVFRRNRGIAETVNDGVVFCIGGDNRVISYFLPATACEQQGQN